MESSREDTVVDVVDDVQRGTCVVIWWEGGDEPMSVGEIGLILRENWWGLL